MKLALALLLAAGVRLHWPEGSLRGYPVVRDVSGKAIGVGTVTQTFVAKGVVRVVIDTHYFDGRRIEERMRFREGAQLEQLDWDVEERQGDDVTRKFTVDMTTGHATYFDKGKEHTTTLAHTTGAFAGGRVMFAAKNALVELERGERVELPFVGFLPSPHVVKVSLSLAASKQKLAIGGREIEADEVVVHPEIPQIAKILIKAPDTMLWFSHSSPPAILRADTTMIEPSDPSIRIELVGSP